MSFSIMSEAFVHKGSIPTQYTCQGQDISPPLAWVNPPPTAQSLALIVDDPDAPDPAAPKMTYVHWVVYNIPVQVSGLPEGVHEEKMPKGAVQGKNDWGKTKYGGPCPPIGRHRYFFKLYALDVVLSTNQPLTKMQLEQAMEGHIIKQTELIGTYQKVQI